MVLELIGMTFGYNNIKISYKLHLSTIIIKFAVLLVVINKI